jgi:purine-binding chemotaxis protein CheW
VQEIRGYEQPTRLAGAPGFVCGVLNLRGVFVPVVDLRMKFGVEARFDTSTVTVVLNVCGRTVGGVVDSVSDVIELQPLQILEAPRFSEGFNSGDITGLGTAKQGAGERLLILLDIQQVMTSDASSLVDARWGLPLFNQGELAVL